MYNGLDNEMGINWLRFITRTLFLFAINRRKSDIAIGESYLTLLSRLTIWSNLPFSECRLLRKGQIHNITTKHWKNGTDSRPVSSWFWHAQQAYMYAFEHLHLKAWIPYCWVYKSHNVVVVPQFSCLKLNKCERQKSWHIILLAIIN